MRKILLKIEKCFPSQKSKSAADYFFFLNFREDSGNCTIETLEGQTRRQGSFRKEAPQAVALSREVEAHGHWDTLSTAEAVTGNRIWEFIMHAGLYPTWDLVMTDW